MEKAQVNCISASGMHFKDRGQGSGIRDQKRIRLFCLLHHALFILLLFPIPYSLLPLPCHAELLDRVVAIVDDEAITLSELNQVFQDDKNITREEALEGLINRNLLLKAAKKFSPLALAKKDDNTLISEYIERRLRAFIHISFEEVESFYKDNKESFGGKDVFDVKDDVEKYLMEKELNKRLKSHIDKLRKDVYIKIQLTDEEIERK